jgi:hypothetical protein
LKKYINEKESGRERESIGIDWTGALHNEKQNLYIQNSKPFYLYIYIYIYIPREVLELEIKSKS